AFPGYVVDWDRKSGAAVRVAETSSESELPQDPSTRVFARYAFGELVATNEELALRTGPRAARLAPASASSPWPGGAISGNGEKVAAFTNEGVTVWNVSTGESFRLPIKKPTCVALDIAGS